MKRILLFIVCLLAMLSIAAAAPQVSTQPPEIPVAVTLILPIIIGRLAVPLINWLKKDIFKWTTEVDKKKNVWLAFGVSLVLAAFTLVITGSLTAAAITPEVIIAWTALTFAVATLIYKGIMDAEPPAQPSLPGV